MLSQKRWPRNRMSLYDPPSCGESLQPQTCGLLLLAHSLHHLSQESMEVNYFAKKLAKEGCYLHKSRVMLWRVFILFWLLIGICNILMLRSTMCFWREYMLRSNLHVTPRHQPANILIIRRCTMMMMLAFVLWSMGRVTEIVRSILTTDPKWAWASSELDPKPASREEMAYRICSWWVLKLIDRAINIRRKDHIQN